jgi:hypothetical protein
MKEIFVDIVRDREEVYVLRDKILEYILERVEKFAKRKPRSS